MLPVKEFPGSVSYGEGLFYVPDWLLNGIQGCKVTNRNQYHNGSFLSLSVTILHSKSVWLPG